jgi:type I restriction enzyme R subunit
MTVLGGERSSVQNPLIQYAVEAGWTYISPEQLLRLRGGEEGLLLREVFMEQSQKLNPGIVDRAGAEEIANRLSRVVPRIEGNLDVWEYINGLKTVFVAEEKRERDVRLLADSWERNAYHVTDEMRYFNGAHRIRLDIVFYVNGIPILLIETKSATKVDGISEALKQVRRYHEEGPELMAIMQLHALTHLVQYYYGPTWNTSHKSLFNWKSERPASASVDGIGEGSGRADPDFETLVKTFIHPQRLTRMLTDFILFTHKDDELSKVILRPHQMRAVERIVRRAGDPGKRRGLIWHTQGSGKTYTMIVAAKQIIENPTFENPSVLMLVDRNELEAQLFGNLASVGFEHVVVAGSKRELRGLLSGDRRGLIVSMIHKFDDIPADLNKRSNIFVLVDEAHRTTGGDLGNYLMAALPNATYIGFTGTPIDRTVYGKGTFKVFGVDDPQGYLDRYTIAESIQDKTTVPLHYALAPAELRVDRETLEREFLALKDAEGLTDVEELNRILEKAVTLRNMLKNRERMERVAHYVADHYRQYVEPMGYKAFLVAVDREACAWYKDLLDRFLPPEYSQVVYSPAHNDERNLSRFYLSDEKEQAVRKAFRKPEEQPRILIVTEKLLTGFDAPVLYCMYLDKPMRDHVLLQAIARVNRPFENENGLAKPCGFVLDFVGIFEKLEEALAFDSQDVADIQRVVTDISLLKSKFAQMMDRARIEFLTLTAGQKGDKAVEAVIEYFRDEERRQEFYRFFRELADLYEIISPDAFLRPYLDDYDQVARMFRLLRSAYDSIFIDSEITRKTAMLVQEHTLSGEFPLPETLRIYEINDGLLERLASDDAPDTVKVFNLLKSIEQMVAANAAQAPYLLSIGERAQAIAEAYQLRQQATLEALKALEDLIREINQAERERNEKALSPTAFALYWTLNKEGLPDPEGLARELDGVLTQFPHWQISSHQETEVRRKVWGVLIKAKSKAADGHETHERMDEIKGLVDKLLRIVGRAGEAG